MKAPVLAKSVVRFEIAPRSIALVIVTVVGIYLAYRLWAVELMLIMALILAGTFNPLIEWMERHSIRRTHALIILFIAMVVVTAGIIFLTVPPLVEQLTQMVQNAPATRTRLIGVLNGHAFTVPLANMVQSAGVEQTIIRVESYLLGYSTRALRGFGYGLTTLMLTFYLLADGKRVQGVAYAIVPRDYHMRLARILQNMETIVGGYMRGQLITSASIGVFTFVLLTACRVPDALSLALFAALVDVIPFVGGLMVVAPAVLSSLSRGLPVAIIVLVSLTIYMEFESRVLVPRIYGQVLRLSSTAVILALAAGATLMGIMGALLALPIAAGLLMILHELRVDLPGDDSVDPEQARQAKTEATYEQMSAGATAPDAGEIAKNLAADIRDADLADLAEAAKHPNEETHS